MKKIFIFLFLAISLATSAQDIYSISKPLQLKTVNPGSASDSVLVRGADKIVKYVPRSEFGGGGCSPITGAPDNLPKINPEGTGLSDSSINDYGDRVVINKSVEIENYTPDTSGLKFANLKNPVLATVTNFANAVNPKNAIFDSSGNLFVSTGIGSVVKTAPNGTQTSSTPYISGNILELGFGSFNSVYLLNGTNQLVQKLSSDLGTLTTVGTTGGAPKDMFVDMFGDIYVVNSADNTLSEIPSYGGQSILGATGANPSGVVKTMGGDIFVTNKDDNTITKLNYSGVVNAVFATTGASPQNIILGADGNLYVLNTGDNTVSKVTMSGVSTVLGSTGSNPNYIISDSGNNIYVACDNNVIKITPSGVSSIYASIDYNINSMALKNGDIYVTGFSSQIKKLSPPPTPKVLTLDGEGNVIKDSKDYVATDNIKTINGQAIVGQGNLVVAPTLQQIYNINNSLDAVNGDDRFHFSYNDFEASTKAGPNYGSSFKSGYNEASIYNDNSVKTSQVRVGYGAVGLSTGDSSTGKTLRLTLSYPTDYTQNTNINVPLPETDGDFTLPLKIDGEYADVNGNVKTGGFAVDNSTTSTLSASTLTLTYPDTVNGFRVHCTSISGGALTYEKTSSGWIQYPITVTP